MDPKMMEQAFDAAQKGDVGALNLTPEVSGSAQCSPAAPTLLYGVWTLILIERCSRRRRSVSRRPSTTPSSAS